MNRNKLLLAAISLALLAGCRAAPESETAKLAIRPNLSIGGESGTSAALFQLGRYYQGQNRADLAIAAYRRALAKDASLVDVHNNLGILYSQAGRYDEAESEFRAALKLDPRQAYLYSNLGFSYFLQGEYARSVAVLAQALTLDPNDQRAKKNLETVVAKLDVDETTLLDHRIAQVAGSTAAAPENVVATAPSTQLASQVALSSGEHLAMETQPESAGSSGLVQVPRVVYELAPAAAVPAQAKHESAKPLRVEVANANGQTGMAQRVRTYLSGKGYAHARLTNQKPYTEKMTLIQYRQGYIEEARRLQAQVPGHPRLVQFSRLRSDIALRLLLGADGTVGLALLETDDKASAERKGV